MLMRFPAPRGPRMTAPLDPAIAQIIPLLPLRDPDTMTPQSARDSLRALAPARRAARRGSAAAGPERRRYQSEGRGRSACRAGLPRLAPEIADRGVFPRR